jgi:sulfatase modifying factor 1
LREPWQKSASTTEAPPRRVEIAAPFYLVECEVPVGAFRAFVEATGHRTTAETNGKGGRRHVGGGNIEHRPEWTSRHADLALSEAHPVVEVSLKDAEAFCAWLGAREGRRYAIPNEQQWEFACRGGTTTRWWNGNEEGAVSEVAWTQLNATGFQPVGRKAGNPFGLRDMHGNVEEVCPVVGGGAVARGGPCGEGPPHDVILTKPYYMGVHDVTVGQFKTFVTENGYQTEAEKSAEGAKVFRDGEWQNDPQASWKNSGFEQTDGDPVVCVSWNDARAFCNWLSARESNNYALPTEAQWEYACRAGSRTRLCFGDDDEELAQYAWYDVNARLRTHPVGQKKPNAWGLHDMHGNVWQWTADWYAAGYYQESPREDPPGPSAGVNRVSRGGAWTTGGWDCRAARRLGSNPGPSHRVTDVGFRVVLVGDLKAGGDKAPPAPEKVGEVRRFEGPRDEVWGGR